VDNTPYFKDGQLIGRRGGIRRHLEREIPELYARYKTVMRYKALSKRFRQAVGVSDPVPAASLLPEESSRERSREGENSLRNEISGDYGEGMVQGDWRENVEKQKESLMEFARSGFGARKVLARKVLAREILAREILAREILEACEGSAVSLAAQLELRTNPNYTPPIRISRRVSPGSGMKSPLRSTS